jgi:hypothetical protein
VAVEEAAVAETAAAALADGMAMLDMVAVPFTGALALDALLGQQQLQSDWRRQQRGRQQH